MELSGGVLLLRKGVAERGACNGRFGTDAADERASAASASVWRRVVASAASASDSDAAARSTSPPASSRANCAIGASSCGNSASRRATAGECAAAAGARRPPIILALFVSSTPRRSRDFGAKGSPTYGRCMEGAVAHRAWSLLICSGTAIRPVTSVQGCEGFVLTLSISALLGTMGKSARATHDEPAGANRLRRPFTARSGAERSGPTVDTA